MSRPFAFELVKRAGAARRGRLHTAHGVVETPAFMPVGTAGTVKAMTPDAVRATGAEIILANTYHLMLRPGAERIARLGGLHRFMDWPGPILTDSGGYQVMSLAQLRSLSEEGVAFQSHLDGAREMLTPERAIEVQRLLDATIAMALDECTEWPCEEAAAAQSMRLSMRWAERSKAAFRERPGYGLFGIVQGSVYPGLREESAKALRRIGFEGYGIGGLAVGEGQALMFATLEATVPQLPADGPRYLMGVGKPDDIIQAVARGIDLFDCVLPTRSGRTGQAFTRRAAINLRNARHAEDPRPLDAACLCPACRGFSRA
ncbi:MAG TPA: tRNA guanosine(34) transglycosylase Tgt, partial [Alphaproteobacteria bacterium]|nr:tRNA guanosine(34) transglycosylase Tgt [Alphaproteobacteria bacterium]